MSRILGATLLTLVLSAPAPAADWPGFAGPEGDYTTDETDLAGQWGPDGPELDVRQER
jgi:hypothetical protein